MDKISKELHQTISEESMVAILVFSNKTKQLKYVNKLANSLYELDDKDLSKFNINSFLPNEKHSTFVSLTTSVVNCAVVAVSRCVNVSVVASTGNLNT